MMQHQQLVPMGYTVDTAGHVLMAAGGDGDVSTPLRFALHDHVHFVVVPLSRIIQRIRSTETMG